MSAANTASRGKIREVERQKLDDAAWHGLQLSTSARVLRSRDPRATHVKVTPSARRGRQRGDGGRAVHPEPVTVSGDVETTFIRRATSSPTMACRARRARLAMSSTGGRDPSRQWCVLRDHRCHATGCERRRDRRSAVCLAGPTLAERSAQPALGRIAHSRSRVTRSAVCIPAACPRRYAHARAARSVRGVHQPALAALGR